MNPYISHMVPVIGFVLGVFFTWFLMYSKSSSLEKTFDVEKKKLIDEIEELKNSCKQLADFKQKASESERRIKEHEVTIEDLRKQIHSEIENRSQLQHELKQLEPLQATVSELQNQTKELPLVKERLESEKQKNEQLKSENQKLCEIQTKLSQIDEIKQMYSESIQENQAFRSEELAKHFIDIKDGLKQSIHAYNRMLNLVDNPLLSDSRIIEIDAPKIEAETETANHKKTVEEDLDKMDNDTDDLKKLDGENDE